MTTHALITSIEEATKQNLWILNQDGKIPSNCEVLRRIKNYHISGKRTLLYLDTFEHPNAEVFTCDHKHILAQAINTTCALGFVLKDLDEEFCSRFVDDLMLVDKKVKAIENPMINTHASLGACIGEGNKHLFKYSILGHVHLMIRILLEEILIESNTIAVVDQNAFLEDKLSRPTTYKNRVLFPAEISALKLAAIA